MQRGPEARGRKNKAPEASPSLCAYEDEGGGIRDPRPFRLSLLISTKAEHTGPQQVRLKHLFAGQVQQGTRRPSSSNKPCVTWANSLTSSIAS